MSLGPILPGLARLQRQRDPLGAYRCAGEPAEWVTANFGKCRSIYNHAANRCSKTTTSMAIAAAMARGRPALSAFDGTEIPIPCPGPRVQIAIGTPTYKVGEGSAIDYFRAFLGHDDVREGRTSAGTATFHVKHRLSRDETDWSIAYVFPYDGAAPEEIGLDAWFADGPPPMRWLTGVRNRRRAGRELHGLITATPANALEWEPLREAYPEAKRILDASGKATVQSSVYDNRFLHVPGCPGHDRGVGYCGCACPDIVGQEQENAGMADARARLFGEHVDIRGGCPYAPELLNRWESLCVPAVERIRFAVQGERTTSDGYSSVSLLCDLDVWEYEDPDDEYLVLLDPGRGLDDGRHDPDGIHVRSRRSRALVARASQYLGAWGLGAAGVKVAEAYGNAELHVARGGGYGDAALSAARVLGYGNLGRDRAAKRTSRQSELGIGENASSRHEAMLAVQAMLQRGETRIPSVEVIRCFRHVIVNKDGKIEATGKYHDEDWILIGHGERLLDALGPLPPRVQAESGARQAFNRSFRADFGFAPDGPRRDSGGGQPRDGGRW